MAPRGLNAPQILTRYGQALHAVPQIRSLAPNKKDRLQDLLFDSVTHTDRDLRIAAVMFIVRSQSSALRALAVNDHGCVPLAFGQQAHRST